MNTYSHLQKTFSILLIGLFVSGIAQAAKLTVTSPSVTSAVIELYTSEGCSSCPPADKWISQYKPASDSDGRVIALAFHVDYWNYLGWKDIYSQEKFTARQQHLGSINKQNTIYTPEFFVNASEARRRNSIPAYVKKINNEPSTWDLTLTSSTIESNDTQVSVQFSALSNVEPESADTELYLALYENNIVRKIGRGENKNKTLKHDFVVRDWQGPISFDNVKKIEYSHIISLPIDSEAKNTGVAAILIDSKTGKTLQAVKSDLKTLFTNENEI